MRLSTPNKTHAMCKQLKMNLLMTGNMEFFVNIDLLFSISVAVPLNIKWIFAATNTLHISKKLTLIDISIKNFFPDDSRSRTWT